MSGIVSSIIFWFVKDRKKDMLCSEIVFLGMIYHFMLMFGYGDYCMMLVCLAANTPNVSGLSNEQLLFFV